MSHTTRNKAKLVARVRRIKGQCEAIERALENDVNCATILQLIAGTRGAMNSLMAEVLDGHLHSHVLYGSSQRKRSNAADELLEVVRTYLK